jgi:hypothetical protein
MHSNNQSRWSEEYQVTVDELNAGEKRETTPSLPQPRCALRNDTIHQDRLGTDVNVRRTQTEDGVLFHTHYRHRDGRPEYHRACAVAGQNTRRLFCDAILY